MVVGRRNNLFTMNQVTKTSSNTNIIAGSAITREGRGGLEKSDAEHKPTHARVTGLVWGVLEVPQL